MLHVYVRNLVRGDSMGSCSSMSSAELMVEADQSSSDMALMRTKKRQFKFREEVAEKQCDRKGRVVSREE